MENNTRLAEILKVGYNSTEIQEKRQQIAQQLQQKSKNIKGSKVSQISAADIRLLFELYDVIFLKGWFKHYYSGELKFSLSRRMTKSAGLTLCPKNIGKIEEKALIIEIRMGVDLFFKYDLLEGSKEACGVKTDSSLAALQVVLEHELCHAIEFICLHKSSCKGKLFKSMAHSIFGHTQSYHQLPTQRQIATERLGLSIGDTIIFESEGKSFKGIINNINKRATVMVIDSKGNYRDSKGARYSKYYVPLNLCKKA